jgi:hypothetical protein
MEWKSIDAPIMDARWALALGAILLVARVTHASLAARINYCHMGRAYLNVEARRPAKFRRAFVLLTKSYSSFELMQVPLASGFLEGCHDVRTLTLATCPAVVRLEQAV